MKHWEVVILRLGSVAVGHNHFHDCRETCWSYAKD